MARRLTIESALLFVFGLSFLAVGGFLVLQSNSIASDYARHRLAIGALVSVLIGFVFIVTSVGRL